MRRIDELRKEPGVQGLVQLAQNALNRIRELESELANHKKTYGSPINHQHLAAQGVRLYNAVHRLAALAGEEADDTVDWLCGEYGGMAKLFDAYFGPKENQTTQFCPMCEGKPSPREPLTDDEFTTAIEVAGIPIEDVGLAYAIKDLVEAAHGINNAA